MLADYILGRVTEVYTVPFELIDAFSYRVWDKR